MPEISKYQKNTPVSKTVKKLRRSIKKKSYHLSEDLLTSPSSRPEIYFSFYFEGDHLLYDRTYSEEMSVRGRNKTGITRQQINKLTKDIFDAFDPLAGDSFDFQKQRDSIDVFLDLATNHFRRIFTDQDQEIIREICDGTRASTHAATMVFRHYDFHYPWGLLNFRRDVTTAADITSLEELSEVMLGSYAIAARVPIPPEAEHRFGEAKLEMACPKLVFAGGDLKHVQRIERPFFKRLGRTNHVQLREFEASRAKIGEIERSLFSPRGVCDESVFHIACHAQEIPGMGQTLYLDGKTKISVTRLQNQDIAFSGNELVFMNACETASYKLSDYADLVRSFVKSKNGVLALVGTDCTVGDRVSAKFALQVYLYFIYGGLSIGDSIVNARRKLIKRGSLVGYAYSVFGNPYLQRVSS